MSVTRDVAVVGSPSTNTELTLDLLQEATEEKVIGLLSAFSSTQNGESIVSIGQITGIELKNRWHEDSVFRNLLKRTGEIPPITNRQDTRTADFFVGATFRRAGDLYEPEVLGMVPPTGTRVFAVDQELLDDLLGSFRDELFYLGNAYANDIRYPMWFKHFGRGDQGAGEAYHIGVFGKSGSGKTTLAKMVLCAYAQHREMGMLIIDPQGEFAHEFRGQRVGEQGLPIDEIFRAQGRNVSVFSLENIQLTDWTLFADLLVSQAVMRRLNIPAASTEHANTAAELIVAAFRQGPARQRLDSLVDNDTAIVAGLTNITNNPKRVYSSANRADQLVTDINAVINNDQGRMDEFRRAWNQVARLFARGAGRRPLLTYSENLSQSETGIINAVMGESGGVKPAFVIDISEEGNRTVQWSENLQKRILTRVMSDMISYSSRSLSTQESANALVVLDEAHRHAPSGSVESEYGGQLRSTLKRAVRETRKYGLGWCFISQTLGGMDSEILNQLRMSFFGFGLAFGSEFDRLKDFAGGDKRAMELYQSFRDPASFPRPELKEYPFMAVGPVSPLAFAGKPLFFSAFTEPEQFVEVNDLMTDRKGGGNGP